MAAGLACAGGATLLAHPLEADAAHGLGAALARGVPAALVSPADGRGRSPPPGPELDDVHGSLGSAELDGPHWPTPAGLLRRGATATDRPELAGTDVLVDLWVPVPSLLVVGAGAIAEALEAQAARARLGLPAGEHGRGDHRRRRRVHRRRRAGPARPRPGVRRRPARRPARTAAASSARSGSRRTQAARRERLLAEGVGAADLARIHGPVGLDLGARTPAETAVSIVAEVVATRSGRDPGALTAGRGQIGA